MNVKSLSISLFLATTIVLVRAAAEPATIHEAARIGDIQAVQRFLDTDSSLANKRDQKGFCPLHLAAANNREEITRTLLLHNADPDGPDSLGNTPLFLAVSYNNIAIVRSLLAHGANPNYQNNLGYYPLHVAVIKENSNAVDLLLEYGANPSLKDDQHKTPQDRAIDLNYYIIHLSLQGYPRLRKARLALFMGIHPRTGANSPLQQLGFLPVQLIAQLLHPEHFADQPAAPVLAAPTVRQRIVETTRNLLHDPRTYFAAATITILGIAAWRISHR